MARLLIAGSDTAALDLLRAEIEADNHEVCVVPDGYEAYGHVLSWKPDAVFLEVHLKVFDGFETARKIRRDPEAPARLPVVLLIAQDLNSHEVEQAGVTACFPKRHEAWELREFLSRLLSGNETVFA